MPKRNKYAHWKYTIELDHNMRNALERIAREEGMEQIDVIKRFVALGLLACTGAFTLYVKREDVFSKVEIFPPKPQNNDSERK